MLKEGQAVGHIGIYRLEVKPFTQTQMDLLSTFANQAVIAIENVRLFKELQAKNAELIDSLEQQTATGEILRIISQSPNDTQPVFDAIVKSAVRLFDGMVGLLHLARGDHTELVASSLPLEPGGLPLTDPRSPAARTIFRGEVVQINDIFTADVPDRLRQRGEQGGFRSLLSTPLLREGKGIGALQVSSPSVGPFTDKQIELLKTFADQAVIAIENVRLFKELKAKNADLTDALEQQTATTEILRVISSSPTNVQPVFDAIAQSAARLCAATDAVIRVVEGDVARAVAHFGPVPVPHEAIPLNAGTFSGRALIERRTIHIDNVHSPAVQENFPETWAFIRGPSIRFRSILVAPLLREDSAIGTIDIRSHEVRRFSDKQVELLQTFAAQAVIAIENVRLFKEIQEKSRQLEIANRHKSEFLANMSHELRTPLNAVIGFSEVLEQRMFGELNDKQAEYIDYIHTSGSHLLSLINDILDLSKVEAGRMELDLSTFSVPLAIDNALTLVRERATRHGLTLESRLDPAVAEIEADERKIKQILLNLLSNAVKFTPEGGTITVAARSVDRMIEVSVTDTGIGIAPEDCEAVFEEFRQVGTHAEAKAQGTGLGLALAKKFIGLHGGTIWLKSAPGSGSTFSFTLPITQPQAQAAA